MNIVCVGAGNVELIMGRITTLWLILCLADILRFSGRLGHWTSLVNEGGWHQGKR